MSQSPQPKLSPEELDGRIETFGDDLGLVHNFVHGAKDETVPLGDPVAGGPPLTPTPTLRGLVESVKLSTHSAISDSVAGLRQHIGRQIRQEGDTQVARVQDEATYRIGLAAAEADRATSEADRARAEADRAVDMTGVGAAGKTNFGFVRVGEGINVTEDGTISANIGMVDYTLPVTEASGTVPVLLAALGHPPKEALNPVINLLSASPYFYGITRRDQEGFTVQIYRPDGSPGADIVEFVELGTFECGDNTECGQQGGGADVTLLLSLPL